VKTRGEHESKIRLLGICGSPRKGNSLFLLEEALGAAVKAYPDWVETETYLFGQTPFAPCDACRAHIRLKGDAASRTDSRNCGISGWLRMRLFTRSPFIIWASPAR